VTFNPQIRYSDALRRGQKQEAIMQEIMRLPGIEEKWESEEVERTILRLIG
jgi:kynurenine 3-monooxygenase